MTDLTSKIIKNSRKFILNQRFEFISIFLLLCVATFFRLWKIDQYMTFLGDEGRDALVLLHIFTKGDIPFIGPTASVGGFFLGPLYYYLIALPFLFAGFNPVGPAIFVALVGVGTVFLLYLLCREWFGVVAALSVSLLYSISPVIVAGSRSSWNPNPVPFVSLFLVYALYKFIQSRRPYWIFFLGIACGIGVQLHYLFLFMFVFLFLIAILDKKMLSRYYILLFIFGCVLPLIPFIGFEIKNNFPNTRSVINFLLIGKDTGVNNQVFLAHIMQVPFQLYGRLLFTMADYRELSKLSMIMQNVYHIGVWLYIVGQALIIFLWLRSSKTLRTRNTVIALLFSMWFVVPTILFGFYKKDIYDYYLGIMYPLPFIGLAFFVSVFKHFLSKSIIFISLLFLLYINLRGMPFQFPPNNQYYQTERIARKAYEMTELEAFNFALIADGNTDHTYRFFFEKWGNVPVSIQNRQLDPTRNSVTKQLIVICEIPNCQPLGHPLWEIAGFGRAEVVTSIYVPFVTIYKLEPYIQKS